MQINILKVQKLKFLNSSKQNKVEKKFLLLFFFKTLLCKCNVKEPSEQLQALELLSNFFK